jgi:hypothetical protein
LHYIFAFFDFFLGSYRIKLIVVRAAWLKGQFTLKDPE